jgi:hypothetical protein
VVVAVAEMLEESRAEHRHRARRPRDRRWLRHAVRAIVDPAEAPTDSLWHAAWAAGLLLARVDARVLYPADVRDLRRAVTDVLGARLLRALRRLWRQAHAAADTDAEAMLAAARQWCRLLGIDPDTCPHPPRPAGRPGAVAAAVAAVLARLGPANTTDSPDPAGGDPADSRRHPHSDIPLSWTPRPPTDAERHAAARLAALLRRARPRDPVRAVQDVPVPPGRLRTRHAVAAAAQKAAGAVPTARPWQRTVCIPAPDPRLAVGVLVDVSGSMHAFAASLSSAAWILAHAAVRADATTATIAFGDRVTVLTGPGQRPGQVRDMRADSGYERFEDALALADRLLGLTTPGRARLLVVVSDGNFVDTDRAQQAVDALRRTGCALLWLAPAGKPSHTYQGVTTIAVEVPENCVALIGRAAADTLARG